jgi:chemotaxis protein methyltransferase WspC
MQMNFENMLKETIGLDSTSIGSPAIESAVRSRMASLGLQHSEEYWELIRTSRDEFQELVETVVVPETWFFRDEEAFAALVRLTSNEWLPNHSSRTLRLLSGPCCSGEEPYSMVMALLDAGLSREQFHVDAVDISMRSVERAKSRLYGANSFRGGNLAFRDRYFEQTPNGYLLADGFSDIVTFCHGNLLAPDFRLGAAPYDVIFCRNLLIYFDRKTQEQIFERLGLLLTPSGFLFVGSAEAFLASCNGFKAVNESMSFAFRKEGARLPETLSTFSLPAAEPIKNVLRPGARRAVRSGAAPVPVQTPIPPPIDLDSVRRLADAGRLAEASELCETRLREQGASAETLYLLGVVKDAVGDQHRAAECYRKVLYLEPNHTEALMHLALLTEKEGDTAGAKRLRERARRAEVAQTT